MFKNILSIILTMNKNANMMSPAEYDYWMQTRARYQANLNNKIGHKQSIELLLEKIEKKLATSVVRVVN